MSYNPAKPAGPGNWPPVESLLSLTDREAERYFEAYLFARRTNLIIGLPAFQNVELTSKVKWAIALYGFQQLFEREPGSGITQGHNFLTKLGRAYKLMRELVAKETSTDPGNMKQPRLKLSFGAGAKSSSYVVCKGTGLLTMSTDCKVAGFHQVRQIGGKCIHCGRTPV